MSHDLMLQSLKQILIAPFKSIEIVQLLQASAFIFENTRIRTRLRSQFSQSQLIWQLLLMLPVVVIAGLVVLAFMVLLPFPHTN